MIKYLLGMENDIIYVFDIQLMEIYNKVQKEEGRWQRQKIYTEAFTKI